MRLSFLVLLAALSGAGLPAGAAAPRAQAPPAIGTLSPANSVPTLPLPSPAAGYVLPASALGATLPPVSAPPAASAASPAPASIPLETHLSELPAAVKDKFAVFFEAGEIKGSWQEPDFDGTKDNAAGSVAEALPADLIVQLQQVSRLSPRQARALIERLSHVDLQIRGPPQFSPNHTFSLELEFLVNRQVKKLDLAALFRDNPLSEGQRADLERDATLPAEHWLQALSFLAGRVIERMPAGWRLTQELSKNTLELKTANNDAVYHVVSDHNWAELTAGLDRVQPALPAGFYSVHIHNGYKPRTVGRALDVNRARFARLTKTYEAMLRALAGMGYAAPTQPKEGNQDQIVYLGLDALAVDGLSWRPPDKTAIHLSSRYPTVETRIVTGLLRDGADGPARLDSQRLAGDLWWTFALMRALVGKDDFHLVTLGLPVTAGLVPTAKQLLHFADRLYKDDLVGKALALQRLSKAAPAEEKSLSQDEQDAAQAQIRRQYEVMGLGVVYRLHAENQGIDERLIERLLGDRGLLNELAGDLADTYFQDSTALMLFPASMRPRLAEALSAEHRQRQTTPWWRRLATSLRRVLRWIRRL